MDAGSASPSPRTDSDGRGPGSAEAEFDHPGLVVVGDRGDQWIGAEPLSNDDAALMLRQPGSVFLKATRTTFDRRERFMEHVESLLDPVHFRLHLAFGSPT